MTDNKDNEKKVKQALAKLKVLMGAIKKRKASKKKSSKTTP